MEQSEQLVKEILFNSSQIFADCDSVEAIGRKYRRLAVQIHPDKCDHPQAAEAFKALKTACGEAETSLRGPCCQRAATSVEEFLERFEVAKAVAAASKALQHQRNAQAKATAAAREELFKGSQPNSRKTNTVPQDSSWKQKSKERQKETKKDKAAWKAAKEAKAATAAAAAAAARKGKKVAAKEALKKAEEVLEEKGGAAEVDSQMAKGCFHEASGEMGLEFHEDGSGTGEGQDWADALKAWFSSLGLCCVSRSK
eukprot:s32_g30.t1